jgi:hypothetical protein
MIDGLDEFTKKLHCSLISNNDTCITFKIGENEFDLFVSDFYILSNAALRIAAELHRRQYPGMKPKEKPCVEEK